MSRRLPRNVLIGLVIGAVVALVGLLAIAVIGGGGASVDPARLKVGDCFDVPTGTDQIGGLQKRGCGGPHGGEVFHIFDAPPAGSVGYPSDTDFEAFIYPVCDPEFETFTGTNVADRLDIEYRYLVPTADRWTAGDRRITCFIRSPDGSPLNRSFRLAP